MALATSFKFLVRGIQIVVMLISRKSIFTIALCALLSLPLFFIIPIVRVTRITTYRTWYSDGSVEVVTDEDTVWVTLYQFLFGGELFFNVADIKSLKEALESVRFKEEYRPPKAKIECGEKSAILMKYLKEKGFKVDMGRGMLYMDEEGTPHAWILVHLEDSTYVIEVNTESGFADIVGTVKEAAESPTLKYEEKERWNMEKVMEKYRDLLKEPLDKYLEIKKK